MYNDLIYKVEERMNNQIRELEKMYNDNIERARIRLEESKAYLNRQLDLRNRQ